MKIRLLASILAILLSFSVQSISTKASGVKVANQSFELLEIESEENNNEENSKEESLQKEADREPIIESNNIQLSNDFEVSNGVLVKYHGPDVDVVIPGDIGIVSIGKEAFYENKTIQNVVIPEGVVSIEDGYKGGGDPWNTVGAFWDCNMLQTVTFPNTLSYIGANAFGVCENITNINIPQNVTYIGNRAFIMCWNLGGNINIPQSVEYIGAYAFGGCKITNINIPSKIVTLEEGIFSGCSSLTQIDIPDSVKNIGAYTFRDCSSLTQIDLPDEIEVIGDSAFAGCTSLIQINIPNGVTEIGYSAFAHCEKLTQINLPGNLLEIRNYMFLGCKKLKNITIPESVTDIKIGAFFGCTSLTEIIIPNSVRIIDTTVFSGCTSLKTLKLSNNLEAMGHSVFSGCSNLKNITIPSSVTKLLSNVFMDSNLKKVIFLGNAPEIIPSEHAHELFSNNVPKDLNVYYLSGKTGYGSSGVWYGKQMKVYNEKVNNFVSRLYEKVLNRKPDEDGSDYHAENLNSKQVTGADAARGFVFSAEVINRKLSNTNFIKMLYQAFMGRDADASGLSYWKNMLDNGVSREFVFKGFAESPEFTKICTSYGISRGNVNLTEPRDQNPNLTMFVFRCYQKALGRNAEVDGVNYYAQEILLKRVTPLQAAQNFIFSPEFKNKNLSNEDYVKVLYSTFMGREFDQSGLNYHLNRMKNGTSREEILLGFAYSPEFKKIMSDFGL